MTLLSMVRRYLMHRPVITFLMVCSIALGAGLISGVLTLRKAVDEMFLRDSALYDMVVGGKGSPLQLVLSSVYHMDVPTGNIPLSMLDELRANPKVSHAIPISLGDNVGGYRIVGTDEQLFAFVPRKSDAPLIQLESGRSMNQSFEAVVGAEVAGATGLTVGDTFVGVHGLVQGVGMEGHDEFPYTVVGIMTESGTAMDRVVLTPLESVWEVHDGKRDGDKEITSVLVSLKAPGLRLWFADQIQREYDVMASVPLMEMLRLQQRLLNPLTKALLAISILVVLVSAMSIAISMMLTADRRQRDWRVLRNLGARPGEIFGLLFLESAGLALIGVVLGAGMMHGVLGGLSGGALGLPALKSVGWQMSSTEGWALLAVFVIGIFAGFVPAALSYMKAPEVR